MGTIRGAESAMGQAKNYMIWYQGKYGANPEDMSLFDEYLEDQRKEREEWLGNKEASAEVPNLMLYSPSLKIILDIKNEKLSMHDLEWHQFEDIVAELLTKDGYKVIQGTKTKDGGVDIFAEKYVSEIGNILTIWQAKKLRKKNKVGLRIIRELADTRNEMKASKGIIVTNTSLTKGAIERITKDTYLLEKVDGVDLKKWIQRIKI